MKATSNDKQLNYLVSTTREGNYKVIIQKYLSSELDYLTSQDVYGFDTKEKAENYIRRKAKRFGLNLEV